MSAPAMLLLGRRRAGIGLLPAVVMAAVLLVSVACGTDEPMPTPIAPTPFSAPSPTPTVEPTPVLDSVAPLPAPPVSPTPTPAPTPTPTPTPIVVPTPPTPSPTPTLTPSPTPSPTPVEATPEAEPGFTPEGTLRAGSCTFLLEVADTGEEKARGLMNRPSLPADRGMIFVYEAESVRQFWMLNTLIPLDILFIDSRNTVVDIQTMVPEPGVPTSELTIYQSAAPAQHALEVNAGMAERCGIVVGTPVTLELAS